jgi:hypothetical protein
MRWVNKKFNAVNLNHKLIYKYKKINIILFKNNIKQSIYSYSRL